MRIILASKSPRRREILSNIGIDFEICESSIIEDFEGLSEPEDIVKFLAHNKAQNAAEKIDGEALIIGADTIVVIDKEILGKPLDENNAYEMLSRLSGRWHSVYTGLCIINNADKRFRVDYEVTDVKFRELTDEQIYSYIKSREPEDKAGSYAVQGLGSLIVERINGCYFNVVGLPVSKLYNLLKEFGVDLLG